MGRLIRTLSTLVLTFALLGASGTAAADTSFFKNSKIFGSDESFLTFNTFSLHFENFSERRNVTPGIGWEYSPSKKLGFHVGTVQDSFGFQSTYAGLNVASRRFNVFGGELRFILGATVLHKQFRINSDPETRVVPLPVVELKLTKRLTLNVSGSPALDFQGQRTNGVLIFQGKLNLF